MNVACIVGRLTADPELKVTQNGKNVTSFCVAVNRRGDGADFIDCVAWEKRAEHICKYFSKGKEIAVSGEIQTRTYDDSSGKTRKVTEINVKDVSFVGKKEEKKETVAENELPF